MSQGLMVIVPPHIALRATDFRGTLAGSDIRVLVDRRQGERRSAWAAIGTERRQDDRRATPRVVAYVHACPVVAVGA